MWNAILSSWHQVEFAVSDYMMHQPQVTAAMRAILVDWLAEIQQNFELHHESLYLAVKLTDRYLERSPIEKERIQLVGSTALLVASKYEVTGSAAVCFLTSRNM